MADGTLISWTDATANVINGCTRVSPGCGQGGQGGCYAERMAGTRLKDHPTRLGLTRSTPSGPRWTGVVRFHEPALQQVLHWRKPRMIFWCAHGDMFHSDVPDAWIDRCFAAMALTPQHTHQVLTKRSARMREYMTDPATHNRVADATADLASEIGVEPPETFVWPLPNVWKGVSVENQQYADERVPDLLATPAEVRWLSIEPMLGPVDLRQVTRWVEHDDLNGVAGDYWDCLENGIDWAVVGGESGPGARPMHPDWARSLRDQCAAASVPFHFKQWGEWAPHPEGRSEGFGSHGAIWHEERWLKFKRGDRHCDVWSVGKARAGRLLDGVLHDAYPL